MGGWEEFGDLDGYLRSIDTMCKLITVRTFRRAQGALLSARGWPKGEGTKQGSYTHTELTHVAAQQRLAQHSNAAVVQPPSRVFAAPWTAACQAPRRSAFSTVQLSHPYMATAKPTALTRRTFVSKVMSLLFNTPSRFFIALFPSSKHLLISWLQ